MTREAARKGLPTARDLRANRRLAIRARFVRRFVPRAPFWRKPPSAAVAIWQPSAATGWKLAASRQNRLAFRRKSGFVPRVADSCRFCFRSRRPRRPRLDSVGAPG